MSRAQRLAGVQLVALACAVAAAAGAGGCGSSSSSPTTPSSSRNYDGNWVATVSAAASESVSFSFRVVSNAVTSCPFSFGGGVVSGGICGSFLICSSDQRCASVDPPVPIVNDSFTLSRSAGDFVVQGTLTSSSSASGSVTFRVQACSGGDRIRQWTAIKQ